MPHRTPRAVRAKPLRRLAGINFSRINFSRIDFTRIALTRISVALACVGFGHAALAVDVFGEFDQVDFESQYTLERYQLLRDRLPLLPGGCPDCPGFTPPGGGGGGLAGVILFGGLLPREYIFSPSVSSTIFAGSDAELAPFGDPLTLTNTRLNITDSFVTSRDFVIGHPDFAPDYSGDQFVFVEDPDAPPAPVGGWGVIHTGTHTLQITGMVTSHQSLYVEGNGTLWLTGNNHWAATPFVLEGATLKGSAASLNTGIFNLGTVEFHESLPFGETARYDHVVQGGKIVKSGAGSLLLEQSMSDLTGVEIREGSLSIDHDVSISGRVLIASNGMLTVRTTTLDALEGDGQVELFGTLTLNTQYDDTVFGGTINGGAVVVRGKATTFTGVNNFNSLRVESTTLGVGQGASLGHGEVVLDGGRLDLAPGVVATQNLYVETEGTLHVSAGEVVWQGGLAVGGQITKTGAGVLALTNELDPPYIAGTFLHSEGTLRLPGGHHFFAHRLIANGRLEFAPDSSVIIEHFEGQGGTLAIADGVGLFIGADEGDASFTGSFASLNSDDDGGFTGSQLIKIGNNTQTLIAEGASYDLTGIGEGRLIATPGALGVIQVNNLATLELVQPEVLGLDASPELLAAFLSGQIDSQTFLSGAQSTTEPGFGVYGGYLTGTGNLVKSGSGIVYLSHFSDYTGGTLVAGGALIGNANSLQGQIENHAHLAFNQFRDDGVFNGQISGSGVVMSFGNFGLTLTGENTYTGGTVFSNTLRVADDRALGASSSALLFVGGTLQALDNLTLNRAVIVDPDGHGTLDTQDYRVELLGDFSAEGGPLLKRGTGDLVMHGLDLENDDPRSVRGTVVVEAGTLFLDGFFDGGVGVAAGGEFNAGEGIAELVMSGLSVAGTLTLDLSASAADSLRISFLSFEAGSILRLNLLEDGFLAASLADPASLFGTTLVSSQEISGFGNLTIDYGSFTGLRLVQVGNSLQLAPVPEPETWAMLAAGLGLVGWRARRRVAQEQSPQA